MCVADKKDVRFYLRGFNVTKNHIEATDGKVLLRMKHDAKRVKEGIYIIKGRIPAKCINIKFKKDIVEFLCHVNTVIGVAVLEKVDGKYPNFDKVISELLINPACCY